MKLNSLLKITFFTVLSGVGCACSAHDTKPVIEISAKLKFLSMQNTVDDVAILQGNGKKLSISAATGYISLSYEYKGPEKLTFVRAPKAKSAAEAKPVRAENPEESKPAEILAVVTIPQEGGDLLILLSGDTTEKLYAKVLPFSSTDVPAGSCLVWNITSRNLGFLLGGQKALIASGQRQLIRPSSTLKNYFDLKVFDEYEGKARSLMSGDHYLNESSRQLLLIADKAPGQPSIRLQTIEELPEKPKRPELAMNH